jgi:hypothetical protein
MCGSSCAFSMKFQNEGSFSECDVVYTDNFRSLAGKSLCAAYREQ